MEEVRRLIITITFNLCTVVKVGALILIIVITEFTYSGLWVAMSFFLTYNLMQCFSLFKIKPTYQGAGRVCQHKPYLLARWQEWFITFTDLGKAKWSRRENGDKGKGEGGHSGAPGTSTPLRRPYERGENLKKSCFHPKLILSTLRVSAFPETCQSA